MRGFSTALMALTVCIHFAASQSGVRAEEPCRAILPEQRRLEIRAPDKLRRVRLPEVPVPSTVVDAIEQPPPPTRHLALDEAIRIALARTEVVRVLSGTAAASSGQTIYDPAIAGTGIDRERGRFDPAVSVQNRFNRQRAPVAEFDGGVPSGVSIGGDAENDYEMALGVSKTTTTGGSAGVDVRTNPTTVHTTDPLLLNPYSRSSVDFFVTQPLLQGAGRRANLAPIVLARIDTERSFYQLKYSVQRLVQSVIDAYWSLVFARTDVAVRRQQTRQGYEAYEIAEANLAVGRLNVGDKAQAESSWRNFQAAQIAAESAVLQREQALRDLLNMAPFDGVQLVPVTPPLGEPPRIAWEDLLRAAEESRCDLIELKLAVEAGEQRLLVARNTALPRVDATALYRLSGLEGRTYMDDYIRSRPGEFTGWQMGIDVSLPLGLREARAELRRQELALARYRADLDQALHFAVQALATRYRNVAQYYREYLTVKQARQAAHVNLELQREEYRIGRTIYLNLLQAITSWGNAVSAEAEALLRLNSELAALEVETGIILESHGVQFYEELYGSPGPAGRLFPDACYPRSASPGENAARYPAGDRPSEAAFEVERLAVPQRLQGGKEP